MKDIVSTITRKGQVTVPAEVRRHLGIGTPDKVVFVIEGEDVRLKPVAFTLDTVFGSIPARPGTSADFEQEIEEAKVERERLDRALARTAGFLSADEHPHWTTPADVSAWVREQRVIDDDASEERNPAPSPGI